MRVSLVFFIFIMVCCDRGPPTMNIRQDIWNRYHSRGMALAVICNVCGGSSTSTCQCARARFMASPLPPGDLERYRRDKAAEAEDRQAEIRRLEARLALLKKLNDDVPQAAQPSSSSPW